MISQLFKEIQDVLFTNLGGKTTVVPRLLIKHASDNDKIPRIVCCQPRRIACLKIAQRVSDQLSQLQNSNYTAGHRIMNDVNDRNCNILFSTTGYLVQWLAKNESALDKITHFVLDEAHERSVDLDILALLLSRVLKTNPTFKLIIMSVFRY